MTPTSSEGYDPSVGTTVPGGQLLDGRYRLLELLGQGAAGTVHRAVDEQSGRVLAIKHLQRDCNLELMEPMLAREYRTLAQLHHPSIIEVFEYGSAAGRPYYAMELLEGGSLRGEAGCEVAQAMRYLRDVASCLALLHARRLVHRDVSPNNVQLSADGRAKLIDFGALSAFGRAPRLIGTPPSVAPEALRGAPLDGRTDLYALGAVAYHLLTGRHAYPARDLRQLQRMWLDAPARPRELRPEIPERLDALVMGLLSADPLARPQSAAEVIDELNHVAGLEPEALEISHAYLDTPTFVGQEAVLGKLRRVLDALGGSRGSALLICGAPGAGKSRVLEEVAVQAQLQHALVLSVATDGRAAPFELARSLARLALELAPQQTVEAARRRIDVIGHVLPDLVAEGTALCAVSDNAQAWRLQLQSELASFWLELADRLEGLVLLVDDCAQADDASCAMLAAIAAELRDHPLLIAASDSVGDPDSERAGLRALHAGCRRLDLAPLSAADVRALLDSLFGAAPNLERLSQRLYEGADGNPLLCMEVAQALLREGKIRYVDGAWFLPQELPEMRAAGLSGVLELRLAQLAPGLARVATGLSVLQGAFSPEHVAVLFPETAGGELWMAIDGLLADGMLRAAAEGYVFAQESYRVLLYERLQSERARELHRRIGRALADLDHARDPGLLLDAGYHLLSAGELDRGATMLAEAGEALLSNQNALADAAPVLERAYARHRELGRQPHELLELLVPLAVAGYMVDRKYADRHGELAFEQLLRLTGLSTARRWAPVLRGKSALTVGALASLGTLAFKHGGGLVPDFKQGQRALVGAYVRLVTVAIALVGVGALLLNRPRVRAIVEALRPLSALPEDQVGSLRYRYCQVLLHTVEGREADAQEMSRHILAQFEDESLFPELDPDTRANWRGGLLLGYGINECYRNDDSALQVADSLDAVGTRLHAMFATQVRMLYHAYRGEMPQVEKHRKAVEEFAMRGGTTWQAEVVLPTSLLMPYSMTEDRVGLRRVAQQIEVYARDAQSLAPYVKVARGLLARLRGDDELARELLEEVVAVFAPRELAGWAATASELARAYIDGGQLERAHALCAEVLARVDERDVDYAMFYSHAERAMARAEAGLGRFDASRARLRAVIERQRPDGNPLLMGMLHDDACRVELLADDVEAAAHELARVRQWFRATGSANLIARAERLTHEVHSRARVAGAEAAREEAESLLEGCESLGDCAGRVLELLAADAGASAGRLFLRRGQGVVVAAELGESSSTGPTGDDATLVTIATGVMGLGPSDDVNTATATASDPGEGDGPPRVRPVVLRWPSRLAGAAMGTALLWSDDELPRAPDSHLVLSLGSALSGYLEDA